MAMDPESSAAETWSLVETWDASPAFAMGLDEALMRRAGARPTLRLYTWAPDALSLGYFQPFEDVPAAARHGAVVRRVTGGGAIHHHSAELTFSITLDARHPAYAGSVPRSYERTHEAVALALRRLGATGARMRREEPCASDVAGTGMCFHESTPLDVCWEVGDGADRALAKGVGTAQRRTGGRVLHHGSIKLDASDLEPGVATVRAARGPCAVAPTITEAADALRTAIEEIHGVRLEREALPDSLIADAEALGARYAAPDFVHRTVLLHVASGCALLKDLTLAPHHVAVDRLLLRLEVARAVGVELDAVEDRRAQEPPQPHVPDELHRVVLPRHSEGHREAPARDALL